MADQARLERRRAVRCGGTVRVLVAAQAPDRGRAGRPGPGRAPGSAAVEPRTVGTRSGPPGPGRAAGRAGGEPGTPAGPGPLRPDAGLAVHLLPGRRADHGGRPGADPGQRGHRAGVRRRPPVEFRHVRHAGAADDLRHQRFRRDPPRPVGVGRQAAGGELRDHGPRPRLLPGRPPRRGHGRGQGIPGPDAPGRRDGKPGRVVRAFRGRDAAQAGPQGGPGQAGRQERGRGGRGDGGQGKDSRQHQGVRQAGRRRSRASCASSPTRRSSSRSRTWSSRGRNGRTRTPLIKKLLSSYRRTLGQPAPPARGVPLRPLGLQDGGRGQRRDPLLHHAADRPRP